MVIFIPEEKSFTSKICELIDKAKTVYNRGIAYFIKAGFSLGYEDSEVYMGNEFISNCVKNTTNVAKAHVASALSYSYDAARRQIDCFSIYHRNTPITESMQTKAASTWLVSVNNFEAVETLGSKLSAIDARIQQFLSCIKCQFFASPLLKLDMSKYIESYVNAYRNTKHSICQCVFQPALEQMKDILRSYKLIIRNLKSQVSNATDLQKCVNFMAQLPKKWNGKQSSASNH